MPERFRLKSAIIFTTLLFVGQVMTGTNPTFALLVGIFVMLFVIGFNIGGGMFYMAGAYIFFNAVITCILAFLVKVVTREPGQTNLLIPNETMLRYCGGMAGMLVAAFFSQRLRPKKPLLASLSAGETMKHAAIGCLVLGLAIQAFTSGGDGSSGSLGSALAQINHFVQMSIILGVTYEIRSSNGKRSMNWIVISAICWLFFYGAINFSKEGMLIGPVTYMIPAAALRFNFSLKQVAFWSLALYVMLHWLVPFSQYGRGSRTEGGGANRVAAIAFLRHPEETRQLYLQDEEIKDADGAPHYFTKSQGLFDREQMIAYDDALNDLTDHGNVFGLSPVFAGFANIVPHFIWHDKPTIGSGNDYGRELNVIASDDFTTGISFSPTGDAYHEAKWVGILVVEPIVLFMLFFICDTVAGDTRKAPWNLLLIALCSHIAPEGLLQGPIYIMSYGVFSVVVIALLSRYVLPYISRLVVGGDRARVERTIEFRPSAAAPRFSSTLPPRTGPQPPATDIPASSST